MVTIRKRLTEGGTFYELEDFGDYVEQLRRRNIDTPPVRYGVFISSENEQAIRTACDDLEGQIALFFRLGPASGIPYQILGP
jgi:hypothetical protein